MDLSQDTIAAISTPPGTGGIAVLRLSGPAALDTIKPLFSGFLKLEPRLATFGRLVHPLLGGEFDECVVTYYKAPDSVTGDDLVEISIHGGAFLQEKLLDVLVSSPSVRPAGAGEFTLRSFLSGKIDLSRAEAVADLIHAKDAAAHRNARHQLSGALRALVSEMSEKLKQTLALIEAELDFSDQEIDFTPASQLLAPVSEVREVAGRLIETHYYGRILEEGVRIPLLGAPNSGKSSLFNLLLGEDRAIVTEQAGTTRDTIEKAALVADHRVVFVDTAGIRPTQDVAEQSGVQRSKGELETADIVIIVHAPDTEDIQIDLPDDTTQITVFNKLDLVNEAPPEFDVRLSCKTGEGLEHLNDLIYKHVINIFKGGVQGVILSNERHKHVFLRLKAQLEACETAIQSNYGPEYIASDLRRSLDILGEITGETTPDDILNQIFSGFCVGK